MNKKKLSLFFVRAVPVIILLATGFASLNLISCGADEAETDEGTKQLTAEEQKDLARFVEYVFFPTSPYVDKSWVETGVPEDEVAEKLIDFATETAAIQQVYTEFYNAWNAGDIDTVLANLHPYGFKFHIASGNHVRLNALSKVSVKSYLEFEVIRGTNSWGPTPLLTEFYIRRGNVSTPWSAASAKGFNSIYERPDFPGVTYVYLVKKKNKWSINQLATNRSPYKGKPPIRQYFDDPKYKAPE